MCYTITMERSLNILITAGGTSEKIDDVRRITNSGTGSLGAKIADAFISAEEGCKITYICSAGAVKPSSKQNVEIITADDVESVKTAVTAACSKNSYNVIIHSMAISDYRVQTVTGGDGRELKDAKISSGMEKLIIVLEKAPKIIALLRSLAPDAVIFGFKLLADVPEEELVHAGLELLKKNDCDYVLANDIKTIQAGNHEGLLIDKDGAFIRASGKDAIAELIVRTALQ